MCVFIFIFYVIYIKMKMTPIFWWTFFWSDSFFNFFLCCPLPYSLTSGSSAKTLRRGRQPEFCLGKKSKTSRLLISRLSVGFDVFHCYDSAGFPTMFDRSPCNVTILLLFNIFCLIFSLFINELLPK